MKRASPEMLPYLNSPGNTSGNGADVSVLERQQERMKWQQQQQQSFFTGNDHQLPQFSGYIPGYDNLMNRVIKPDPGLENGWTGFRRGDDQSGYGYGNGSGFDPMNENKMTTMADQMVSLSPKKRKAHESQSLKVVSEKEKRMKGCGEEGDSKITNSRETSTENSSKEKSKISEVQKPDYIHVRARRGQATDSHSLAERVRREKISERMKYLQDLVPGCNKITGKAGMLDEIINYVQSLQRQVEFLSMKLATVHPRLDCNIENLFTKEMFLSSTSDFGCSSEMANSEYFQLNSLEQVGSSCGLEMGINPTDMVLRSISAPIPIPETFFDSSCFNPNVTWDADLQNLYRMEFQQGTSTPFQSQQFTGSNEGRI